MNVALWGNRARTIISTSLFTNLWTFQSALPREYQKEVGKVQWWRFIKAPRHIWPRFPSTLFDASVYGASQHIFSSWLSWGNERLRNAFWLLHKVFTICSFVFVDFVLNVSVCCTARSAHTRNSNFETRLARWWCNSYLFPCSHRASYMKFFYVTCCWQSMVSLEAVNDQLLRAYNIILWQPWVSASLITTLSRYKPSFFQTSHNTFNERLDCNNKFSAITIFFRPTFHIPHVSWSRNKDSEWNPAIEKLIAADKRSERFGKWGTTDRWRQSWSCTNKIHSFVDFLKIYFEGLASKRDPQLPLNST